MRVFSHKNLTKEMNGDSSTGIAKEGIGGDAARNLLIYSIQSKRYYICDSVFLLGLVWCPVLVPYPSSIDWQRARGEWSDERTGETTFDQAEQNGRERLDRWGARQRN